MTAAMIATAVPLLEATHAPTVTAACLQTAALMTGMHPIYTALVFSFFFEQIGLLTVFSPIELPLVKPERTRMRKELSTPDPTFSSRASTPA
jgi:hypothetical protein